MNTWEPVSCTDLWFITSLHEPTLTRDLYLVTTLYDNKNISYSFKRQRGQIYDKKIIHWLKKNLLKKLILISFENDLLLNLKIVLFCKQNQNLFDKLVCLTVDLFDKPDCFIYSAQLLDNLLCCTCSCFTS